MAISWHSMPDHAAMFFRKAPSSGTLVTSFSADSLPFRTMTAVSSCAVELYGSPVRVCSSITMCAEVAVVRVEHGVRKAYTTVVGQAPSGDYVFTDLYKRFHLHHTSLDERRDAVSFLRSHPLSVSAHVSNRGDR